MSKHAAEPNDWTRHLEAKREREAANMYRIYGARVMADGAGKRRAVTS